MLLLLVLYHHHLLLLLLMKLLMGMCKMVMWGLVDVNADWCR